MARERFDIVPDCMRAIPSGICGIWPLWFTSLLIAFFIVFATNVWAVPQPFLVKDINTIDPAGSTPQSLVEINGITYFSADDGIHGQELWRSDGTEKGTWLVKDIFYGAASSNPQNLTNVNGKLFFTASDAANGTELWMADGINALPVKDIVSGVDSSYPQNLTNVNGTL